MLAAWGVELRSDLLQDGNSEKIGVEKIISGAKTVQRSPYHYLMHITDLNANSPITRGFGQIIPVFASTVTTNENARGLTVQTLMKTSEPFDPDLPVLLPGEPEAMAIEENTKSGIPMNAAWIETVRTLAQGAERVSVPDY